MAATSVGRPGGALSTQPGPTVLGPASSQLGTATHPNGTSSPASSSVTDPANFPGGTTEPAVPTPTKPAAAAPPAPLSPLQQALMLSESGNNPDVASKYLGQFQQSLAQARGDIATQLAGALQDINQNKSYAQQALGQLPGGINSAYAQARGSMNAAQADANAAGNAPGTGGSGNGHVAANMGGSSLNAYMAPERAAINTEEAANQANVPLLGVGIDQAASQAAAAAQNGALGDYSQLAQQQAQLGSSQDIASEQIAAQQQQQQQAYLQNLGLAGVNNAATLRDIQAQGGASAAAGGVYANAGLTQAAVSAAHADPNYVNSVKAIQSGTFTQEDYNRLQATYPTLYQVLNSEFGANPAFSKPPK